MTPKALTERQAKLYELIVAYIEANGFPPTINEMREGMQLASTAPVHVMLGRLVAAGVIEVVPESPRAIRLTRDKVVVLRSA